ncbi:importin subunit alpha-2-like protein [Tanacetum coccineum]
MSLRPNARTEVRRNRYKVAVDAEEGRRRREDNMVEIRKNKREENLLKKRQVLPASVPSSTGGVPAVTSSVEKKVYSFTLIDDISNLLDLGFIADASVAKKDRVLGLELGFCSRRIRCRIRFRFRVLLLKRKSGDLVATFSVEKQVREFGLDVGCLVSLKDSQELESLPSMVAGVYSNDNAMQLEATTQFRKLLSIERSPPIEEVIQSGVVPRFVEFLMREDFPQLQFEAAWALTNIASGTSENTKVVIDHGAVPIFVKLLASPSDDVREQAVWALGNVAGDSPRCRDLVLGQGALLPLLAQLNEHAKLSMLRNATWTLSNFCRGKPQPPFEETRPALPALERLVHSNDEEVLTDACWALSYLSDGTNDKIQAVIEAGVCRRLVELLLFIIFEMIVLKNSALVTVGDILLQCIIEHGALPCLLSLLTHNHKKSIKKEACWTISNITAGNKEQIQSVIEAGLIAPLVNLLQNSEFDIKKEAAWAISNATSGGSNEQIKYLVSQGCIKPLCDLLICPDPRIITVSLEGLENILKVGEVEKNLGNSGDVNYYAQLIDDAEGLEKIENLQSHDNNEIYEKAVKILETYWLEEEEEAVVDGGAQQQGFNFGGNNVQLPSGGFNFTG